jgi:hypothetical protein
MGMQWHGRRYDTLDIDLTLTVLRKPDARTRRHAPSGMKNATLAHEQLAGPIIQ